MHDETVYAERALRAGARGYVIKQRLDATVLVAIRRVLGSAMYMSDKLEARLAARYVGGHTLATHFDAVAFALDCGGRRSVAASPE